MGATVIQGRERDAARGASYLLPKHFGREAHWRHPSLEESQTISLNVFF